MLATADSRAEGVSAPTAMRPSSSRMMLTRVVVISRPLCDPTVTDGALLSSCPYRTGSAPGAMTATLSQPEPTVITPPVGPASAGNGTGPGAGPAGAPGSTPGGTL